MHQDALLRAICQNPDDDAPRLVFADWCEDHHQCDRAEFVRLQCEWARLDEFDPRQFDLAQRIGVLRDRHASAWEQPLREALSLGAVRRGLDCTFRRGFIEKVALPARSFCRYAAALFDLAPIRQATLGEVAFALDDLIEAQPFPSLTTLILSGNRFGDTGLEILAGSLAWPQLTALDLSGNGLGLVGIRGLGHAEFLSQLTALNLGANPAVGDAGAWALARLSNLHHLQDLNLASAGLTPVGVRGLLSGGLTALTRLDLSYNLLGRSGIEALANASSLSALQELVLVNGHLRWNGARALGESPYLGRLTHVDLSENAIGNVGLRHLLDTAPWPRLRSMRLRQNGMTAEGLRSFRDARLTELRRLDLSDNPLGVGAVRLLAEAEPLRHLNELILDETRLSDAGVSTFTVAAHWPKLWGLSLRRNGLTDAAAEALAAWPGLRQLRWLNLRGNRIGAVGAEVLLQAAKTDHEIDIDLSQNPVSIQSLAALDYRYRGRLIARS